MKLFVKYLTFLMCIFKIHAFDINIIPSLHSLHPDCAISLVKSSTAILPQFDSIGHHVLNANQILINKLLESNFDHETKKTLILKVIDLTREGDEMGGKILQDYYNFIDFLL